MAVPSSPAASQRKTKSSNKQMDRSETQKKEGPKQSKRTKSPGIRVVGGRIYDSQNGKTCHQCRQKTMDFTAACKNMKQDKQCTIKFCHKCLINRYGEKAEEMEALDDWKCPKCRGICNCSFCMKKRGHKPTGILVHTAKATGFSSVSELLDVKGPDVCQEIIIKNKMASPKKLATSPKKLKASTEEPVVVSPKKRGKENAFDGTCNTNLNSLPPASSPDEKTVKKAKRDGLQERAEVAKDNGTVSSPRKNAEDTTLRSRRKSEIPQEVTQKEEMIDADAVKCGIPAVALTKEIKKEEKMKALADLKLKPHKPNKDTSMNVKKVEVTLPAGTLLTSVVGIDLIPEDLGHALQFLEFCSTFGEILGIRKGQAESVLRDIMCGRSRRKGKCSSAIQFLTQLLSFILKDIEEESPPSPTNHKDSWIQSLKKCLSESECELEDIPEDCFDKGCVGYEMLESSQKLRLLTFLCDEALYTTEMRNWIEEQNLKFVEQVKEAKEGLNAAKEKERLIKRKLQDEVAKVIIAKNGAPLTISEHESIVSKIKAEAEEAHVEMLEAMDLVPKKKQRSDAVRAEPLFVDATGRAYWRLNCFSNSDLLCQDIGNPEEFTSNDKWFTFTTEETKLIEKHISSQRLKQKARDKYAPDLTMNSNYSDIEVDSGSNEDLKAAANTSLGF